MYISRDVGASPISGSAIGIPAAHVNGIIYAVDASGPAGSVIDPDLLIAAKGDLTTAYNNAGGMASLAPPRIPDFLKSSGVSEIVAVSTAPSVPVILQACPDLLFPEWISLVTNTPVTSLWSFTNTISDSLTNRFYRVFVNTP